MGPAVVAPALPHLPPTLTTQPQLHTCPFPKEHIGVGPWLTETSRTTPSHDKIKGVPLQRCGHSNPCIHSLTPFLSAPMLWVRLGTQMQIEHDPELNQLLSLCIVPLEKQKESR